MTSVKALYRLRAGSVVAVEGKRYTVGEIVPDPQLGHAGMVAGWSEDFRRVLFRARAEKVQVITRT